MAGYELWRGGSATFELNASLDSPGNLGYLEPRDLPGHEFGAQNGVRLRSMREAPTGFIVRPESRAENFQPVAGRSAKRRVRFLSRRKRNQRVLPVPLV